MDIHRVYQSGDQTAIHPGRCTRCTRWYHRWHRKRSCQPFSECLSSPNSFLDKLLESFAGPHDYLGGVIEGGYDNLGNWKLASDTADNIRGFMTGVNVPLVIPLVIPTLLQQINFDPVAMSNTIHNETD